MGAYFEDYIPRRYNAETILAAGVTPGRKNHWDYKLERGKPRRQWLITKN